MVLRSRQFDDVYFSADDGMAETRHVFMNGNDLPAAWADVRRFTIAETGFGTGLNFLSAWKLFEATAKPHQSIEFISVEKYPLSKAEIAGALQLWAKDLSPYRERYLELYPLRVPGVHRIRMSGRVSLALWIGDIADILPQWRDLSVDAWFLDGFTPAKKPQMWTPDVFAAMARLSHSRTSYASFTAAGDVRRGLEAAGFTVEKVKGFGRKRDMIRGRFTGTGKPFRPVLPENPVIIGGGLAGTALARSFVSRGVKPVIVESALTLAAGASGGEWGMINPKLTARPTAHSDYYTAAYAHALRVLQILAVDHPDICFARHGSLHLQTDADKERRYTGYRDHLGWHEDHMRILDARDAGGKAGMALSCPALYYPDAAAVSPRRLCSVMAGGADIRLGTAVHGLEKTGRGWRLTDDEGQIIAETDALFLANGFAAQKLMRRNLSVHSVRGQITYTRPLPGPRTNLCFGGYLTPPTAAGYHILGSSFQPWQTDTALSENDHDDNIARLNKAMGYEMAKQGDIVGGWAALRTSSKDRFPLVGQIDEGLYLSAAHGSHGIVSSLMAADILISRICGEAVPAAPAVLKALDPLRFDKP